MSDETVNLDAPAPTPAETTLALVSAEDRARARRTVAGR